MKIYPSDLSDEAWAILESLIPLRSQVEDHEKLT